MLKKFSKMISVVLAAALTFGSIQMPVMAAEVPAAEEVLASQTVSEEGTDVSGNGALTETEISGENSDDALTEISNQLLDRDEALSDETKEPETEEALEENVEAEEVEGVLEDAEEEIASEPVIYTVNVLDDSGTAIDDLSIVTFNKYEKAEKSDIYKPAGTTPEFVENREVAFKLTSDTKYIEKVEWCAEGAGSQVELLPVYVKCDDEIANKYYDGYDALYILPSSAAIGNIDIFVTYRALNKDIALSFVDSENRSYVSKIHDGRKDENGKYNPYINESKATDYTYYFDEALQRVYFEFGTENGYSIDTVTSSDVDIFYEANEYANNQMCWGFYTYGLSGSSVTVNVTTKPNDKYYHYVTYDSSLLTAKIYKGGAYIAPDNSVRNVYNNDIVTDVYLLETRDLGGKLDNMYSFHAELNADQTANYKLSKCYYSGGAMKEAWEVADNKVDKSFALAGDRWNIEVTTEPLYTFGIESDGEEVILDSGKVYKVDYKATNVLKCTKGGASFEPLRVSLVSGNVDYVDTLYDYETGEITFNSSTYGKVVTVKIYDDETDKYVGEIKVQSTLPVQSVELAGPRNRQYAVPFGGSLKYKVTVNSGSVTDDLDVVELDWMGKAEGETYTDYNRFIDCYIDTNGYLVIDAAAGTLAGEIATFAICDAADPDRQFVTFKVIVNNPSWKNSKPIVKVTEVTDVSITLSISAPKNIPVLNPDYAGCAFYYNILATPVSASETDVSSVDDRTIDDLAVTTGTESVTIPVLGKSVGEGHAAKFNIDANIVLVDDSTDDIYAESAYAKLQKVSTKQPYYIDKISIKRKTTSLYAGQSALIAAADFGSNATYIRADQDWFAELTDSSVTGINLSINGDREIYAAVGQTVPAGTYKVRVYTVGADSTSAATEAFFDLKVLDSVAYVMAPKPSDDSKPDKDLEDFTVYMLEGKDTTYDVQTQARNQEKEPMKSAKLTYAVGELSGGVITPVDGITVSAKGQIKIAKNFVPVNAKTYGLRVDATLKTTASKTVEMTIVAPTPRNLTTIESTSGAIPANMTLTEYRALYPKEDGTTSFVFKDSAGQSIDKKYVTVTMTDPDTIKRTGKFKITALATDGTKVEKIVNIIYDEDTAKYSDVYLGSYDKAIADKGVISVSKDVSDCPTDMIYTIALGEDNGSDFTYAEDCLVKGIKIDIKKGARKVLKNNTDKKFNFVMTAAEAVFVVTDTKSNTKTEYVLQNAGFSVKAPKATIVSGSKYYTDFATPQVNSYILDSSSTVSGDTAIVYTTDKDSELDKQIRNGNITATFDGTAIDLSLASTASKKLKAGTYTVYVQLRDGGASVCRDVTVKFKLETLKKSFVPASSCKMSNIDGVIVELPIKTAAIDDNNTPNIHAVYNANIKGAYNDFADIIEASILTTSTGGYAVKLAIASGKKLPVDVSSIVGYVGYDVTYIDGSTETVLSKVTVNINKSIQQYTVDKQTRYLEVDDTSKYIAGFDKNGDGEPDFEFLPDIEGLQVIANRVPVNLAKVEIVDPETARYISNGDITINGDSFDIKIKDRAIRTAGTYTFKINVIPDGSVNASDTSVTADNSITVILKLTVKKVPTSYLKK